MADLEITIRYDSAPAKAALTAVVLCLPFWGIMIPAFVIWIGFMLLSHNYILTALLQTRPMQLLGFILGLLLITGLGVKTVLNLSDNRIILSKNGIELPFFLGSTFGLRRNFAWVAISSAQLVDSEKKREIVIHTTDGFPIYLDIKCFAPEELEQFLVALGVWAINCRKTPELELLQDELQKKSDEKLLPSYTAMWDEELSRRFTATAYVPLEPEQVLQSGRLKVVSQLSFGGLSAVYLCQYKERELVVLKESVVPQDSNEELKQKATELFEREARLLMKIDHPAIVKVLDCFVEATRQYLLIEYRSGQDLSQFIKQNGAQPEDKVLNWAAEIVEILDYLHNQDPPIIHRDVTPDNLILDGDGELVMIDFGAANEFLGNATGTLVGKQSFIAPEQFRGHATGQSDLYALGCTLSFLLTAQEPVPLSVSHPQKLDANISDAMDKLIADLTSMNLEGRISSAHEAKARIEEIRSKCLQPT
ncbi:MAG: serine/threonine protein kinase [Candidatus Melainabacteria bacterium]|nr:serine/threonine protein kinase [Candidatus Melainabacteria bacterium]